MPAASLALPVFQGARLTGRLVAVVATLVVLSCIGDSAGPGVPRRGVLAISPSFASTAAGIVPFDRVRIRLQRTPPSSAFVLDTVIPVSSASDTVDLGELPVPLNASSETFLLYIALLNAAGDTVFRNDPYPDSVEVTAGATAIPQQVTIEYTGVGANAASVEILSAAGRAVIQGDTVQLVAVARDSQGNPIAGTPIAWGSLDTARARVPDPSLGTVQGATQRGLARIEARLLTGPADTTTVQNFLPPTAIAADTSPPPSLPAGSPTRATVLVTASDGLGVAGVAVQFAVTAGGGTLSQAADTTDSTGRAGVTWTLGPAAGLQSLQASRTGLTGSPVTFTTNAQAATPDHLAFTLQPSNVTAGAAITPAVRVTVQDAGNNTVTSYTGDVTVAIGTNPSSDGQLFGTRTRAAVAGVATFSDLTIDLIGVGYTLTASGVGVPTGATSASFTVTAGAAAVLAQWTGNSQIGLPGAQLAESLVVQVRDTLSNPVPGVSVDWTILTGAGSLSAASSLTDAQGLAFVHWTLGGSPGSQQAEAAAAGLAGSPVLFGATAVPPGTTKTWTGGFGTDWANPGNWSPSGVPAGTDNVFVPLIGSDPVLSANQSVNDLAIENGATLNTSGFTLAVGGDLSASGPVVGLGTVVMSGAGVTVSGAVPNLTVAGSGNLSLGGQKVTVSGSFTVQDGGAVAMTSAGDTLDVGGSAAFGFPGSANVTAGVLIVRGAGFTGSSMSSGATGTHKTVFAGGAAQTVSIAAGTVFFQDVEIANPAGVTFNSAWAARGVVTLSGGPAMGTPTAFLTGGIVDPTGGARWLVQNTGFNGTNPTLPDSLLTNAAFGANVTLGADLRVVGNLSVSNGTFDLGGQHLTVTGNVSIDTTQFGGSGILVMQAPGDADTLEVLGNFAATTSSPNPGLTAGVLLLRGSFTQQAGSTQNFAPSGTHKVVLNGTGVQTVFFSNYGITVSHFHHVELRNTAGTVVLASPLFATGQLISPPGVDTILGGGNGMRVEGLDADGLLLDNLPLTSTNGTITRFDNVTFQNYDPAAVQLTIAHPGAATPFTFTNARFLTTPGNGAYLSVTDNNTGDGNTLAINMQGSQPVNGTAYTLLAGGAVVKWAGLAFTQQPVNTAVGAVITPPVQVAARDALGNTDTGFTGTVTVSSTGGPGSLGGTFSKAAVAGVATFDDLTVDSAGAYQLVASAASYDPVTSVTFNVTPPGTTKQWLGANTNWSDPANWSPSGTPTSTDNVFIPATGTNPTASVSDTVNDLVVQNGATLTINSGVTLLVGGDLSAGSTIAGPGTVTLSGSGVTVSGAVPSLTITGSVTAGGATTVNGNLTVSSGTFNLGGQHVTVTGGALVNNSGILAMQAPGDADTLEVFGGFGTTSGNPSTALTAGVILLRGNFTQTAGNNQNFAASGTHKVLLNGTSAQTVSFGNPGATSSRFQQLEVANSAGVTFVNNATALGLVTLSGGTASGTVTVTLATGISDPTGGARWQLANTTFSGVNPTLPDSLLNNATFTANATLAQDLLVSGTLTVSSGTFNPGGQNVIVGGNVLITGSGILAMQSPGDSLTVFGNFTTNSGNPSTGLTAGILEVRASFTQTAGSSQNFAASGTHTVLFNGIAPQTVSFSSPGSSSSRFQNVEIANAAGVTFSTGFTVLGLANLTNGPAVSTSTGTLFGGLVDPTGGARWQVANTSFSGVNPTLTDSLLSQVTFTTSATLVQDLRVVGNLTVSGGSFNLGGQNVTVTGNVAINASGVLQMLAAGDGLTVLGNFSTISGNPSFLTAGTLEVRGNFSQTAGSNQNFPGSGTHTVVFNGPGPQTVSFTSPGSGASRFQNVEIGNAAGVSFTTAFTALGVVNLTNGPATGTGPGTLFAGLIDPTGGSRWQLSNTVLSGINPALPDSLVSNVTITANDSLAADLRVVGNLSVTNGTLVLGGQHLTVTGDVAISGSGIFAMRAPGDADTLEVLGSFSTSSGNTSTGLTAGVMMVADSFTQAAGSSQNFAAGGTHKVVLNGSGTQTVSFSSPGGSSSRFQHLEITNAAGASFSTTFTTLGVVSLTNGPATGTGTGTLFGGLVDPTGGSRWQLPNTVLSGVNPALPDSLISNVTITANDSLAARLRVVGDLSVTSGTLVVGGQHLTVTGNLSVSSVGILAMRAPADADTIEVLGNFFVNSGNPSTGLTAGRLYVAGNFTQNTGSNQNFAASGSHTVVLNGAAAQTVSFLTGGPTASRFQNLVIANTAPGLGVTLSSDVYVLGQLRSPAGPSGVGVSGASTDLFTGGLDVDGLTLNGALLWSTGGTITRFDNVAFTGYAAGDSVFRLSHPGTGGPFTFTNVQFNTVAAAYLRVLDSDPTGPDTLTILMAGSTPLDGSSLSLGVPPARVKWSSLVFTVQPTPVTVGLPITPAVEVTARGPDGSTLTGFTGTITVALNPNPTGAVLSGTLSKAAVAGVAAFDDLSVGTAGTGYGLSASSGGMTALSSQFNVTGAVHATDITANETWTAAASPHTVTGYLRILNGATLTIEDGAEIRFDADAGLQVGDTTAGQAGGLVMNGTPGSILLTADTATPFPGFWRGIEVQRLIAPTTWTNVDILWAGSTRPPFPGPLPESCLLVANNTGAALTLDSVTMRHCVHANIHHFGGTLVVKRSTLDSATGSTIHADFDATLEVDSTVFSNAGNEGLQISTPLVKLLPSEGNQFLGNAQRSINLFAEQLPGLGRQAAIAGNGFLTGVGDTILVNGGRADTTVGAFTIFDQPAPYLVTGRIEVGRSDPGGATVTLDSGLAMAFTGAGGVQVGDTGGTRRGQVRSLATPTAPAVLAWRQPGGAWMGVGLAQSAGPDTLRNVQVIGGGVPGFFGTQLAANIMVHPTSGANPVQIENVVAASGPADGITVIRDFGHASTRVVSSEMSSNQGSGLVVLMPDSVQLNPDSSFLGGNFIQSNLGYPVVLSAGALQALGTVSGAGNGRDTMLIVDPGLITRDAQLADYGRPWRLVGGITVDSGATLTIPAGVTVTFDTTAWLIVGGNLEADLRALGTSAQAILITATPGHSDWFGIDFANLGPNSLVQNTVIERAGRLPFCPFACEILTPGAGVRFGNASANSLVLDTVTIRNSSVRGLDVSPSGGSNLLVRRSQFYNIAFGPVISANDGAALTIVESDLYGYGTTVVSNAGGGTVSADGNWWGDVLGAVDGRFSDNLGRARFSGFVSIGVVATSPFFPAGPAAQIIAVPDNFVFGPLGQLHAGDTVTTPDSLRVRVLDASGRGVAGETVSYTGPGVLSLAGGVTDAGGRAPGTQWTTSTVADTQVVLGTAPSVPGDTVFWASAVLPDSTSTVSWELIPALTVNGVVSADLDSVAFTTSNRPTAVVTNARDQYGNVTQPSFVCFTDIPNISCPQPYGVVDTVIADTIFFTPTVNSPSRFMLFASYDDGVFFDSVVINMNSLAAGIRIDRDPSTTVVDAVPDTFTFTSLCPVGGPFNLFCQKQFPVSVVDSAGAAIAGTGATFQWTAPALPDTTITLDAVSLNPAGDTATVSAHANGTSWLVAVDTNIASATFLARDSMPVVVNQTAAAVLVTPDSISLILGDTVTFTGVVVDEGGDAIPAMPVRWRVDSAYAGTLTFQDTSVANQARVRLDSTVFGEAVLQAWACCGAAGPADTIYGIGTIRNPIEELITSIGTNVQSVAVQPTTNGFTYLGTDAGVEVVNPTTRSSSTIAVGGTVTGIAFNPANNRVYAARSDKLMVIDAGSGLLVDSIALGANLGRVAVDSAGNRVFVPAQSGSQYYLYIISGVTDSVADSVQLADLGQGVAYNPVMNRVYVTLYGQASVQVVDPAGLIVDTTVQAGSAGGGPTDVAVNPATNRYYVSISNDGAVWAFDGAADTLITTVFVGTFAQGIDVDVARNRIYVARYAFDGAVAVIDGATNTLLQLVHPGWAALDVAVYQSTGTVSAARQVASLLLYFSSQPPP